MRSQDFKGEKILNVANVYFTLPYFFGNQLSHFTDKGYEVHVICSPAKQLASFAKKHGCKYAEIKITKVFSVKEDLVACWKLYKYMRRHRFDIVSGHTPKAGLLTMVAARMAGVKNRIYFRHGLVYETASGLKRAILVGAERVASICANKVVCVSPYLIERSIKDRLSSKSKMVLLKKGSCTGIDVVQYFNPQNYSPDQSDALRDKLGLSKDNFTVGYVGRLVKDKGVAELVEAFKCFHQKNDKARLLMIGPYEERDIISKETIDTINHHPAIIHVGLIEDNMPLYYSIMDILVLPTHREGLGVALLEAQSMEVPVLTTSHTGSRDAILAGETGEYIEMTAQSIEEKIHDFYSNPLKREKYGRNGRQFTLDNFSEPLIWDEIEKLYHKE